MGAIKEVLDRMLGKPVEADFVERLKALAASLAERTQWRSLVGSGRWSGSPGRAAAPSATARAAAGT